VEDHRCSKDQAGLRLRVWGWKLRFGVWVWGFGVGGLWCVVWMEYLRHEKSAGSLVPIHA